MSRDDLKVRLAHAQSRGNAQKCAMRARLPPPPAQRTSPQRFPRVSMRVHTEHPSPRDAQIFKLTAALSDPAHRFWRVNERNIDQY